MTRARSGMALPIIIAIIFVLSVMIMAFNQYSSSRVRATGALLNGFSALAAAEAGVNCVLLEMRNSQGWLTHDLEIDPGGEFLWKDELPRPVRLQSDSDIAIDNGTKGTYSGKLGSGVFASEFKVRVGRVPLKDDPATPAIDESNRFIRIESIGKKKDPSAGFDRYTKLVIIGEVSNFTEYVIYDGEKVVLGMGAHNDSNHSNVFADGRIYGHEAVKLGNIETNGTVQKFVNLDAIRSSGQIEFKDSYQVSFQKPKAQAGKTIELGPDNDSLAPSGLQTASGNVLDGARGGQLSLPKLDKEFYKKQIANGGLDISDLPLKKEYAPLYQPDLPAEVIELDFGKPGYKDSDVPPDDKDVLKKDYPANFNGLLYSSKPLAVWGCPDRDVTIFCEQDIFLCGDFNIHPDHRQNYKPRYQTPDGTAIDGTPFYQYKQDNVEKWVDTTTGEPVDAKQRERNACALISMGRVWFDYRHPMRFLANELKGLIKFELANELLHDEPKAYEFVRYKDANPAPNPAPIPAALIKTPGPNGTDTLSVDLQNYFGQNGGDSLKHLNLTTPSFEIVKQAFVTAVADGQLTRDELDGTLAKPGVVDTILKQLAADEALYDTKWPAKEDAALKDLTPPELGSFTAPQRLYALVYDEKSAGLTGHPPHGPYSDEEGSKKEMMDDELYMPQMSMYAMVFTAAKRNEDPGENVTDDPHSINRHFDDLGNGRGHKGHYLTSIQGLEEQKGSGITNIITPLVQRFVGSEIRMGLIANHPPALKVGQYWPTLRRRIYDRTLSMHPPPMIPQQVEIRSWQQLGAVKKDYDGF